nr:unnamed protein product [Digitaria exilis]
MTTLVVPGSSGGPASSVILTASKTSSLCSREVATLAAWSRSCTVGAARSRSATSASMTSSRVLVLPSMTTSWTRMATGSEETRGERRSFVFSKTCAE